MRCPGLDELPAPPSGKTGWPWTDAAAAAVPAMPGGRPWPRISIVTPSFNQGRFIEETIRSVLLQRYPAVEYFVMDGGSDDETLSVIRKYEPWTAEWVSEKDRGQSHAINKGMALAHGEIVAYLNSDDVYLPGAFVSAANALGWGGAAWCTSDAEVTDASSNVVHHYVSHVPRSWISQISRLKITTPQPATFWTRALWDACGPFDEEMFYSFDFDLFCKFLLRGEIPVRCRTTHAAMRWHGAAKTSRHRERMHADDAIIWERCLRASGAMGRIQGRIVRGWAGSAWSGRCKAAGDWLRAVARRSIP